jgi:hypothetical protein
LEVFFSGKKKTDGLTSKGYLEYTKLLVQYQDIFYKQLKAKDGIRLEFPKWNNRRLTLKEMEHALCEFSKFQRLERNTTTGRRLRKQKSQAHPARGVFCCCYCYCCQSQTTKTEIIMLEFCDTCNQGYCKECDDSSSMVLGYDDDSMDVSWVCRRCIALESYEWEKY